MTTQPIAALALGPHWTCLGDPGRLCYQRDATRVEVRLERCVAGRLRAAYPVSGHDLEVRITNDVAPHRATRPLAELVATIHAADPRCRRVVFAAPARDAARVAAVQAAGFRYVVDVDVPGAELSLLVAEPSWVTRVDADLDRIPGG